MFKTRHLFLYGLVALPLAFAGLPLYMHLPILYTTFQEMDVGLVGIILLGVRFIDAVLDPYIGTLSDRYAVRQRGRRKILLYSGILLSVAFIVLFSPPHLAGGTYMALWFGVSLLAVQLLFSVFSINYYASGAEMGNEAHFKTRVSAWREGLMLLGVLVASILPSVFMAQLGGVREGYALFALMLAVVLPMCCGLYVRFVPRAIVAITPLESGNFSAWFAALGWPGMRWLLGVFFINAMANAIPSTLVMFFVRDVLEAGQYAPHFMGAYFLSGIIFLPFWVWLAKRCGRPAALLSSMLLSIAVFMWAFFLQAGEADAFLLICVLSGACLGADFVLLPAMLAEIIAPDGQESARAGGTCFGLWNFVWKLAMALASGLVLMLLSRLGYSEGTIEQGRDTLSALYALVPCALKLAAAMVLVAWMMKTGNKRA